MEKQNTDNSKKFKDTKVGKFFKDKAPHLLDLVGDILPDSGGLGVVKNILQKDETIDPVTKEMLHNQLVELYNLEVKDRDSARKREVEINKTGKIDFMFIATGATGLTAFLFIIYAVVYVQIPEHNEKTFYTLIGLLEGLTASIFAFYFGSRARN